MGGLIRAYGRALTLFFFAAATAWALLLIVLPQFTMLEQALTRPSDRLDSSVAANLKRDGEVCASVLERYETPAAPAESGGLAVPSLDGATSSSGMAVPSLGGVTSLSALSGPKPPPVVQCGRATTHRQLFRDNDVKSAWLDETYDLPRLAVAEDAPIAERIAAAREIAALAAKAATRIRAEEARSFGLTLRNFAEIGAPRLIPLTEAGKAEEGAKLSKMIYGALGLRFERGGAVYERLGMITLTRTLAYAVAATALALVVCYPIAYKVALATPPERAVWLLLGLVIPYAIVELMRIYAWTAIIDNRGLINSALKALGALEPGEAIQFKRYPMTVFVVVVYTYVLFMIFPILNVMSTLDRNQVEAARDLGARPWRVHWRIIIPHTKPGIAVGCIATFMLCAGAFSVPRIISRGLQAEWFSQSIYNKFFESESTNVGASYSFAYTLVCFVIVGLFMWIMRTRLKDFARVQ